MKFLILCLWVPIILLFSGCNHSNYQTAITIHIENKFYNHSIKASDFGNTIFTKCSNEKIKITKLNFIVSRFTFYRNGESLMIPKTFFSSDGELYAFLDSIPAGTYDSLSFQFGDNNPFNPNDPQIVAMAWPSLMGGGFHFMQYEGTFQDTTGTWYGFTLHAGGNGLTPLRIVIKGPIQLYQPHHVLHFQQSIDRWMNGPPHCFHFTQANYTMGIDSLMSKLLENGKNAFTYIRSE